MSRFASALDRALDATVLPGYASIGYRLRGLRWEEAVAGDFVRGRAALVTGASSGIGEFVCEGLAAAGARVYMVARNPERAERARQRIAARLGRPGGELRIELADVADFDSVRELAARVGEREGELAVLVNNAGTLPAERTRTAAGLELTFATNVAGPFLLTNLLLDAMQGAAPARVVSVTSGGMYTSRLDADDPQLDRREFDGTRAYAHTKRMQVVLTRLWAERERHADVSFFAAHPGWADTPGLARSLPRFHRLMRPALRDSRQGADTIVWLGTRSGVPGESGTLWHDRRVRPAHRLSRTRESGDERRRLWDELCRLTGFESTSDGGGPR